MSHLTATDRPARTAALIAARTPGWRPRVGLVLGSGLGSVADRLTPYPWMPAVGAPDALEREPLADVGGIPYGSLPGFPVPTVAGHAGRLVPGWLGGVAVACLVGREHFYEGNRCDGMTVALRCLARLGCEQVFLTCAAGSLRPDVGPGRLMVVTDHINLLGDNPLVGNDAESLGPRFPSMVDAWDPGLTAQLRRRADHLGVATTEGVYAAVLGPSFETPAEVRMLQRLGADAVGMSMVPECIVARQSGMKVVGCAVITNLAVGIGHGPVDHQQTLTAAGAAATDVARLIAGFLAGLEEDGER